MKPIKQKEALGLSLSEPRLLTRKNSFFTSFFFYLPLLLLGAVGSLGFFYTAFGIPVSFWPLAAGNLLLAPLFTMLFLQKKSRSLPIFLPPALFAVVVFFWREPLWQGLLRTINLVISAYSKKSGLSMLSIPLPQIPFPQETTFLTAWGLMMSFFLQWGLGWSLVRKHSSLSAFLFSGFFVAIPMVASILPHRLALVLLLLFWGALLLFRPIFHGQEGIYKSGRQYSVSGAAGAKVSALPLLLVLGALMALLSITVPKTTYQRPQLVEDLRSGFIDQGSLGSFFQGGGLGGNTTRVDLKNTGDRKYTGKTMLLVKTSKPVADYLKGFVGSVYTGASWELLNDQQTQQLEQLPDKGAAQLFQGRLLEGFPQITSSVYGRYHLEIEQVGTNPRRAYLPYGVTLEASSPFDLLDDSFFRAGNQLLGLKKYEVEAFWEPSFAVSSFGARLADSFVWLQTNEEFPGGSDALLEEAMRTYRFFDREEYWFPSEPILTYMPEEPASLIRSLSAYSDFARETYTQLPEATREGLIPYLEQHGLLLENFYSSYDLAQAIAAQVQADCSYTLTPEKIPQEKDFTLYFLLESRKGYCVHFATAVTALLRAAGVPARYAEGYVAPPARQDREWLSLPDSSAHAWPEIFLTGMGWTPIEATPGMDFSQQADTLTTPEEENTPTPLPSQPEEPSEPENPTSSEAEPLESAPENFGALPENAAGTGNSISPVWKALLLPLLVSAAVLSLCALSLFLRRRYVLSARKKRFCRENRNSAALSYYAWLQSLLRWGCRFCSQFPQSPSKALEELALKARFSQHKLTPEELVLFQEEAERHIALLEKKLTRFQKWYCRYVLALY